MSAGPSFDWDSASSIAARFSMAVRSSALIRAEMLGLLFTSSMNETHAWMDAAHFGAFIKAERERWGSVVRKAKLKVD